MAVFMPITDNGSVTGNANIVVLYTCIPCLYVKHGLVSPASSNNVNNFKIKFIC